MQLTLPLQPRRPKAVAPLHPSEGGGGKPYVPACGDCGGTPEWRYGRWYCAPCECRG